MTDQQLAHYRQLAERGSADFTRYADCRVDYYCDCHLALPVLVAEAERLRACEKQAREVLGECKEWIGGQPRTALASGPLPGDAERADLLRQIDAVLKQP